MPIGYTGPCVIACLALLTAADARGADGPSPPQAVLTSKEKAWIAAHPVVRMMAEPNWQPGDFIDADGVHRGIGADVLRLVAERTGLRFQIVDPPSERRLLLDPDLRGADGVVISARTPDRSKYYLLTTPYLRLPAYIITRQSVDRIVNPGDLGHCRVSVVAGYASQEYLRSNYPDIVIDSVPDTATGLNKVAFGLVDAFVSSIPVSTYWLEQEGYSNLKINGETGFVYEMGISSRRDWPLLHSILQKGQDTITPEEHEAIRHKWLNLSYEPFFRSRKFWLQIAGVIGIMAALALTLAVWNYLLTHQVRRKTEELRTTGELHRTILESISDAVILTRPDGDFLYVSPKAAGIFGRSAGEIAEMKTVYELAGECLRGRLPQDKDTCARNIECRVNVEGARPRAFLVNISPVSAGLLFVCRDVTALTEIQEQLQQKQKLESIGLLAGGVAHDFNNLMQAVQGFTDLASQEATTPTDRAVYLGEVNKAADRAVRLTRQLLSFARKVPMRKKNFDLNEAVSDMLNLIRNLLSKSASLQFQPHPERLPVLGDPGQIEQVVMNLALNARDAMPEGGTIRVSISRRTFDAADSAGRMHVREGSFAALRVSDGGMGMDKATSARIFEPFFTTKGMQGTGLGLAVVLGIVQTHGGFILVDSEPGAGSTFTVCLPISGMTPEEPSPKPVTAEAVGLSILLADDEVPVLALTRQILEKAGHRVTAVPNGREAIERFTADPAGYDLAILDLVMPGMGGREAAREMRKLSPGLAILFASGHESPRDTGDASDDIPVLAKPFRPDDLLGQMRLAMKGQPSG